MEDFVDLAATRNFTRTADNRLMTQSALSRRIQYLEYWVGSTLFDRKTKPIQLTPEGERFVSIARDMLRLAGKHSATGPNAQLAPTIETVDVDTAVLVEAIEPAVPGSTNGQEPGPQITAERILVVDDSAVSLTVIARVISGMGHEPITFTDGREALASLSMGSAGIVLTDCEMPGFDGYELAKAVRAAEQSTDRHTPIVAVTGHSTLEEIDHCFDVGMDDYLCKPVGRDELEAVIHRWLTPDSTVEGIEKTLLANASADDLGDGEDAVALVRTFCTTTRERVEKIPDLVDQGDGNEVATLLPSIKTEAFMIGAYSFGRSCGQLHKAAVAGDIALMLEKVGPFLADFVKLHRATRVQA